jgi:hypothetical protein
VIAHVENSGPSSFVLFVQSLSSIFSAGAALVAVYVAAGAANDQARYKRLDWSRQIVEKVFLSSVLPAIDAFERDAIGSARLSSIQWRVDAFQDACINLQSVCRQSAMRLGLGDISSQIQTVLEETQDSGVTLLSLGPAQLSPVEVEKVVEIASIAISRLVPIMLKLGLEELSTV